MLNKKKLADFRKTLQGRLTDLLDEADQAVKDISESNADVSSDPTDQAVQELDRNRLLRLKDRERKLIRKIEKAIVKIEDGSYGECEACNAEIGENRLQARPMTTLCIDCATEMENEKQKSKLFGEEGSGSGTSGMGQ
jgi:DnaK suppressor protein